MFANIVYNENSWNCVRRHQIMCTTPPHVSYTTIYDVYEDFPHLQYILESD